MMFKKLNEAIEVHKIKATEITLEEREAVENELIFGNVFENLFDGKIPNNAEQRKIQKAEEDAKKATTIKQDENKKKSIQTQLELDSKVGDESESR